jgi:phosphoribosylanthranilate isomerase
MTKVKICGLKRLIDIDIVNLYLPDYVGFVFASSRRKVTYEEAKIFKRNLDKRIQAVGVFVNEPMDNIVHLCNENVIDLIQLHGDEDEGYIISLQALVEKPIIKAIRVKSKEHVIREGISSSDYLLFDTYSTDSYGGSGVSFNRELIPELEKPYFFAGGLNSDNLIESIRTTTPYCVDISSGVEMDGYKDKDKVSEIINMVRNLKI